MICLIRQRMWWYVFAESDLRVQTFYASSQPCNKSAVLHPLVTWIIRRMKCQVVGAFKALLQLTTHLWYASFKALLWHVSFKTLLQLTAHLWHVSLISDRPLSYVTRLIHKWNDSFIRWIIESWEHIGHATSAAYPNATCLVHKSHVSFISDTPHTQVPRRIHK